MSERKSTHLELKKINEKIEELRDALNEICCTANDDEKDRERLAVSQNLDELIVKYMMELNENISSERQE